MSLEIVQKPVRMSYRVEDLAKSSNVTCPHQTDAVVYRFKWYQNNSMDMNTPEKDYRFAPSATSTPLISTDDKTNEDRMSPRLKRKRTCDLFQDKSLRSSKSESDSSINDCSDENDEGPRKKARHMFTSTQVKELEKCYQNSKYLPIEERPLLAKRLNLSQQQVKIWFQNRRMKAKRQKKPAALTRVDATRTQYSSAHNTGHSSMQFPGYFSLNAHYTGLTTTQKFMFDSSALPYFNNHGYSTQMYNGLSPQPNDKYRQ